MGVEKREYKTQKDRQLERLFREDLVRRYLEIKRATTDGVKRMNHLGKDLDASFVGLEATNLVKEIAAILTGTDQEESLSLEKEELSGLTHWQVIDEVYEGLCQMGGEKNRKFGTIFLVAEDRDWHRTDSVHLGGKGVIIDTVGSKRIALARVKSISIRMSTSTEGGLVYAELNEGDPEKGRDGLNQILRNALSESKSLLVAERALFLNGQEISRGFATEVSESDSHFWGTGRLANTEFVGSSGEEVPPNLRPATIIPSYKEEVVPFLIEKMLTRWD